MRCLGFALASLFFSSLGEPLPRGESNQAFGFRDYEHAADAMTAMWTALNLPQNAADLGVLTDQLARDTLSGDAHVERSMELLMPALERILGPVIVRFGLWRENEPHAGANVIAFLSAFDKWAAVEEDQQLLDHDPEGPGGSPIGTGLQRLDNLLSTAELEEDAENRASAPRLEL